MSAKLYHNWDDNYKWDVRYLFPIYDYNKITILGVLSSFWMCINSLIIFNDNHKHMNWRGAISKPNLKHYCLSKWFMKITKIFTSAASLDTNTFIKFTCNYILQLCGIYQCYLSNNQQQKLTRGQHFSLVKRQKSLMIINTISWLCHFTYLIKIALYKIAKYLTTIQLHLFPNCKYSNCQNMAQRTQVDKNRGHGPRFLSWLRPEGHVFGIAWQAMIKTFYSMFPSWFNPSFSTEM